MNMKSAIAPRFFQLSVHTPRLLLLWVTLLCLCGCHSNGYRKGDAAGQTLRRASDEVRAESQAIDATVAALGDLVQKPAADLKPQFARFDSTLERLVAAANRTEKTRERMEQKNARYFATWDEQLGGINYGIVREHSESRLTEVTNRFYAINSRYLEAQGVVRPLIRYFTDIHSALSVDLTQAGLESVRRIAANAEENSRKVQAALGQLADELASSGVSMSSVAQQNNAAAQNDEAKTSVRSPATTQPGGEGSE
jgi:hypothetical protein